MNKTMVIYDMKVSFLEKIICAKRSFAKRVSIRSAVRQLRDLFNQISSDYYMSGSRIEEQIREQRLKHENYKNHTMFGM